MNRCDSRTLGAGSAHISRFSLALFLVTTALGACERFVRGSHCGWRGEQSLSRCFEWRAVFCRAMAALGTERCCSTTHSTAQTLKDSLPFFIRHPPLPLLSHTHSPHLSPHSSTLSLCLSPKATSLPSPASLFSSPPSLSSSLRSLPQPAPFRGHGGSVNGVAAFRRVAVCAAGCVVS